MKIKFNLVKLEKALAFQITDQDHSMIDGGELWNSKGYKTKLYQDKLSKYKISILSCIYPEITILTKDTFKLSYHDQLNENKVRYYDILINIRGVDSYQNDNIIIKKFDTNEERDLIYDIIIESMNQCFNDKINYENKI